MTWGIQVNHQLTGSSGSGGADRSGHLAEGGDNEVLQVHIGACLLPGTPLPQEMQSCQDDVIADCRILHAQFCS